MALIVVLIAAGVLYIRALDPQAFGLYGDDALYVTSAKALATGQGYRILSLPYEPRQTLYPPLFPFLLSLIWKAYPQFPANLTVMMLLSIMATLGFLALSYRYLVSQGYATAGQGLIVISLAAINWRTMYWATILLSDMFYAAFSVAGLYLAEKYETKAGDQARGIALGVIMGLAFLTRTSAITLIIAVAAYYVLRRKWRRVLLPVAIALAFVIGWGIWSQLNRSSFSGANSDYYAGYVRCFSEAFKYLQALNGTSTLSTLTGLVGTNFALLLIASVPVACLGLGYGLPRVGFILLVFLTIGLITAGVLRRAGARLSLLHIYLIPYFALHLLLPGSAYDRYLMPVVPFLLVFLVTELDVVISAVRDRLKSRENVFGRVGAAFVGTVLLVSIALALSSNAAAIYKLSAAASFKKTAQPPAEFAEAIDWINTHTNPSDVLVCNSDPMYYLYTGRKATASYSLIMLTTVPYQARQPSPDEQAREFLKIVKENNGGYLVLNSTDFGYESDVPGVSIKDLVERSAQMFIPVFKAPDGRSAIYRINISLD
ncbi:MAG: hypothetical protein WAU45_21260 [Blastocatellia bacterium]